MVLGGQEAGGQRSVPLLPPARACPSSWVAARWQLQAVAPPPGAAAVRRTHAGPAGSSPGCGARSHHPAPPPGTDTSSFHAWDTTALL